MTSTPLLEAFARDRGLDLAALEAVLEVEAGGEAFSDVVALDGRRSPVLRGPEVHLLWRACSKEVRTLLDVYFKVLGPEPWQGHKYRPTLSANWLDLHTDVSREWEALARAHRVAGPLALETSSFGLGQVLGMHWKRLGYTNVYELFRAQWTKEGQVETFLRFLATDQRLVVALQAKDWAAFATVYNGPGKVLDYSGRLKVAYKTRA